MENGKLIELPYHKSPPHRLILEVSSRTTSEEHSTDRSKEALIGFSKRTIQDNAKLMEKHGYVLYGTLGEGTYGKVKSAYSKELKRKVAIKIIDWTKTSAEILRKFLPSELNILHLLDHPHVVKTFKIFQDEKKLFIVMELGTQGNLFEFIKARGKLSKVLSKKLFCQLALAIKFIHDQNIVPRDLTCENLLLDEFKLKEADIRFSKRLEYKVLSDTFCGSPELL